MSESGHVQMLRWLEKQPLKDHMEWLGDDPVAQVMANRLRYFYRETENREPSLEDLYGSITNADIVLEDYYTDHCKEYRY